jgi:glycine/D-amino acid oxidase-like deaminating enzyme
MAVTSVDAVVVGGGFYGCVIALHLKTRHRLPRVLLVERETNLLTRASYGNQARLHNGYHYPRSLRTAYRSRANLPRFLQDWPEASRRDFTKLYAVALQNSKTGARQFERFCAEIGARCTRAGGGVRRLFDRHLIEEVFEVEEYAFDAIRLRELLRKDLADGQVELRISSTATGILRDLEGGLQIHVRNAAGAEEVVHATTVFNCTYSALNGLAGDVDPVRTPLKHQVAEIALIEPPAAFRDLSVTVIDGPFFSIMPFPARDLHSLTHVRYTPHLSWTDRDIDPYRVLAERPWTSRADRMLRDAARYFASVGEYRYVESIFEIKTVLAANEPDDGRPILMERHRELPGLFSILGGKIDNVYDVLEKVDSELAHG